MNDVILGMQEAVEFAKANRQKNIAISSELVIDMAKRIEQLESDLEDTRALLAELERTK